MKSDQDTYFNKPEDQKSRGEVFTPTKLVNEMLDKLPQELFQENKTFLDSSCGDGQFLFRVLERKMKNGYGHIDALKTIYGCELDQKNVDACKKRLLLGNDDPRLKKIVDNNIICADALDENHKGWKKVGFYWSRLKGTIDQKSKQLNLDLKVCENENEIKKKWKNFLLSIYEDSYFEHPENCDGLLVVGESSMLCEFVYSIDFTNPKEIIPVIAKILKYVKLLHDKNVRYILIADRNECVYLPIDSFTDLVGGEYEWDKYTTKTISKNTKLIDDLKGLVLDIHHLDRNFSWKKVIKLN